MAHRIRAVTKSHLWFFVYRDESRKREYRWALLAGNNYEIADSGEGYEHVADCLHAINLIVTKTHSIPIKTGPGVILP